MKENKLKLTFEYGEFESGKVFVPVEIDSKKVNFFFDTVATFTGLKDISLLNNQRTVGAHSFQSASGLKLNAKQVICEKLSLGSLEKKNIKISIFPDKFEHDTTLGIDFFENTYFSF